MTDRTVVPGLGLLTGLAALLVPWAVLGRETGSRSTLLLLPDRIVDFTGRTDVFAVPGAQTVLVLTLAAAALLVLSALLPRMPRRIAWLAAGITLLVVTGFGLQQFSTAADDARIMSVVQTIQSTVDNPRPVHDVDALSRVIEEAPDMSLSQIVAAADKGGLLIRRLPYSGAGIALASFMAFLTGVIAVLAGLTIRPRIARFFTFALRAAAVPAVSILLALFASGIVILLLQPTPMAAGLEPANMIERLAGRFDTVWYAFFTLFAGSLATFPGFLEALKFTTPLIFTGLALAFGFRAGQFNIGAPGQMTLGGIFAMLVGIYMGGPAWIVLPTAVLAAAAGGGLWAAVPGILKARFGSSEVITTIMMNYIAASLMLFLLSSNPTFASPALAALRFLGIGLVVLVLLMFIPFVRQLLGRRPRVSAAIVLVVLLGGMMGAGLPHQGEAPVVVQMPFKAPGSEPKSHPLRVEARMPQLPALLGINLRETPGTNVINGNVAAVISPVLALLAFAFLPRRRLRSLAARLAAAVAVGAASYGVMMLFGLHGTDLAIPPTTLNVSFVLAILAAVFMQYLMWRTHWGYDLRAVGVAPKAAEYGGASIARNTVMAMALSGMFAGLTATHYVLGGALEDFALRQSLPVNDGFDGIAVALLGANTPLGVVLAAFLFGVLKNGGASLNVAFSSLTRDVVSMILALVVLFIAARGFLPTGLLGRGKRPETEEQLLAEPVEPLRPAGDEPGREAH